MNDLVTKYKLQKADSAKFGCFSSEGQRLIDAVTTASDEGKQRERDLIILFCSFRSFHGVEDYSGATREKGGGQSSFSTHQWR